MDLFKFTFLNHFYHVPFPHLFFTMTIRTLFASILAIGLITAAQAQLVEQLGAFEALKEFEEREALDIKKTQQLVNPPAQKSEQTEIISTTYILFLFLFLCIIASSTSLFFGIVALCDIQKRNCAGKGRAIFAIIMGIVSLLLALLLVHEILLLWNFLILE